MVLNGSELIDHPWNTTFSTFTDLFGSAFWLIPLSFIAVSLFVKTRNPVSVSAFMIGSGLILGGGNIFVSNPEMAFVYLVFSGLGIVGLVLGIFFMRK